MNSQECKALLGQDIMAYWAQPENDTPLPIPRNPMLEASIVYM